MAGLNLLEPVTMVESSTSNPMSGMEQVVHPDRSICRYSRPAAIWLPNSLPVTSRSWRSATCPLRSITC